MNAIIYYVAISIVVSIGVCFTISLYRTNSSYSSSIIKANRSSKEEAVNG